MELKTGRADIKVVDYIDIFGETKTRKKPWPSPDITLRASSYKYPSVFHVFHC
jgi:hypothetical protein